MLKNIETHYSLMKKPDINTLVEILETLAEQGFIDVDPTERGYDLTPIYDFLVVAGFAERFGDHPHYWLRLLNEDACLSLAKLLREAQPDVVGAFRHE